MRYCFVICLGLFFGCSKKPAAVKAPECKLSSITKYGYAVYPLTYSETKIVKVGDDPSLSSVLTYDRKGRLVRIELPSENPRDRTELFYNDEGKISMEKEYEKDYTGNWIENTAFFFTYTNGKVTTIRETVPWTSPPQEFDQEVIWDGDNIRSIIVRSGATVVCEWQYSYDTTRKNAIAAFIDLYYGDHLRPSFKMPLYFSANLLVKEDTNCPSVQTTNITYDLSDSLHLKIYTNGSEFLAYNYECR
jgi:hypothetical protein